MKCHLMIIILFLFLQVIEILSCAWRDVKYGIICVCNETYCDTLDELNLERPNEYILVSSNVDGNRFVVKNGTWRENNQTFTRDEINNNSKLNKSHEDSYFYKIVSAIGNSFKFFSNTNFYDTNDSNVKKVIIRVNSSKTYQKIIGFGGAITGAVLHNLELLPEILQNQIYESYYSKSKGIGYTFIRTPIGGCDFDLEPWAYNEYPRFDKFLTNFTKLDSRDLLKVKHIEKLQNISNNYDIKILATAWSSPTWMKTNNAWTGFSAIKKEYLQTWADYHLKFLELMKAQNISIWGISTGNEPVNGWLGAYFVHFMSLGWNPAYQAKWLKENLGPTIRHSDFKNINIIGNEDQRYTFPGWFETMNFAAINSTDYLDILGVHWYWDQMIPPKQLDYTHDLFKDKMIINTESCVGDKPWEHHGPKLGDWSRAEHYIRSYIQDLQHSVSGWIDWNLCLNEVGGPNYVQNYVDAPIIVNTTNKREFYKQPIFYAIGHFSKFIHTNSIKIDVTSSDKDIDAVAFKRPDNNIVLIIYNSKNTPVYVNVFDTAVDKYSINNYMQRKTIHTIIYNNTQ